MQGRALSKGFLHTDSAVTQMYSQPLRFIYCYSDGIRLGFLAEQSEDCGWLSQPEQQLPLSPNAGFSVLLPGGFDD